MPLNIVFSRPQNRSRLKPYYLGVQTPVGFFSTQFLRKKLVFFAPEMVFSRFSGAWSPTSEKQHCWSSADMILRHFTLFDAIQCCVVLGKPTELWTPNITKALLPPSRGKCMWKGFRELTAAFQEREVKAALLRLEAGALELCLILACLPSRPLQP